MNVEQQDIDEIIEAFKSIEKHDLKPSTIICSVCGCIFTGKDEYNLLCEHLKELFEGLEDW